MYEARKITIVKWKKACTSEFLWFSGTSWRMSFFLATSAKTKACWIMIYIIFYVNLHIYLVYWFCWQYSCLLLLILLLCKYSSACFCRSTGMVILLSVIATPSITVRLFWGSDMDACLAVLYFCLIANCLWCNCLVAVTGYHSALLLVCPLWRCMKVFL